MKLDEDAKDIYVFCEEVLIIPITNLNKEVIKEIKEILNKNDETSIDYELNKKSFEFYAEQESYIEDTIYEKLIEVFPNE